MGLKPKVTVKLIKCGNCGRSYNNPLTHVCRVKFSQAGSKKVAKPKGKR